MEKTTIHNLIILDESGSMQSIYNQALNGVNETIQTIKETQELHPEMVQRLTLATFSGGERFLRQHFVDKPITKVREFNTEQYRPHGCTALYDAMGKMISRLQGIKKHNEQALVTIITDGEENASQEWTASGIKSLVEELRHMGWTFTYIGANQDAVEEAAKIGVRNALNFYATERGTKEMFKKEKRSRQRLMEKFADCIVCANTHALMEEDADYFDE